MIFIQHSMSSARASICQRESKRQLPLNVLLFVKKKDGYLGMYVNDRGLNKVTIKNLYHCRSFQDFFEKLVQSKIHLKIVLCGAYNLICIKEDDKLKTAIQTIYRHFQYNVMHFSLIKACDIFQP